jgi:acyl-CoA dehydrogenase
MSFEHTDAQRELRLAVRELAGRFGDDYWLERDRRHEFPWEFYDAFAAGGWVGIGIPTEYGGAGLGVTEGGILLQEVAASGAGINGCTPLHLSIFGMNPVVKHGSEDMRARHLPRVAAGELHVAFAVTEPDAGTDTTRIATFARRDGDDYVVSGRKVWISKAQIAEKMLLIARTTPRDQVAKRTEGLTLFFTDLDRDRVDVRPIEKLGRHAVDSNELLIDELRVPAADRVGEEGKGLLYLLDGLNPERILMAHEAVGLGRAALERAVRYANERVVFDRPIGSNQGIQFPLADALARLDAAELVARHAAWRYDAGLPCGREANTAKYLCAEAGWLAADRAVQTHGGMGYAVEYHVERLFREARLLRIAPVSQEIALSYLGEHVLGLPRSY